MSHMKELHTDVEYVSESLKVALADTGVTGTDRLDILRAVAERIVTELEEAEGIRAEMPAIVFNAEACDSWLDDLTRMVGWEVTVTLDDGTEVEGELSHAGYDQDNDGMASIWLGRFPTDGGPAAISSESITSIYVH